MVVQERASGAIAGTPLVSVIVPVYQGEKIIMGAVLSALNQTYANLEVIVVDDGSTDATLEVLHSVCDTRLRVVRQANAGTAAARNRALELASGAYVAFLDSDDRWLREKIAIELATLVNAPAPFAIAYSSYFAVDDAGRLLNASPKRTVSGDLFDLLLDGDDFLMPSVCLFDRRVIDDIGPFNVGRYHEDHEYILRASRKYPIFATGRHLAAYRQSTSGKCRSILADFDRARGEELSILEDFASELTPGQIERLRRNVLRALYVRFLMYGFDDSARRLAPEVDLDGLRASRKERLAQLFARTGVNLLAPARIAVQTFNLRLRQAAWAGTLRTDGLELLYGS